MWQPLKSALQLLTTYNKNATKMQRHKQHKIYTKYM